MRHPTPLRVLLVEESLTETFQIVHELQRGGLEIEFERVETADYLESALEKHWDVIVCDTDSTQLEASRALAIVREKRLDVPFLTISAMARDEEALELLRAGAHDFILKENLARLAPAVQRELLKAEERRQHVAP